jgi:alpha-L-fucosidase
MTTRIILSMWLTLAFSVCAGELRVDEKTLPDGLTELRVVSDVGKDLAVYKVDLKTHNEPATNRTGIIKQWESWRYGAFFCFNDNQFTGKEFSKNKDAKLFNPSKLDIAGWAKTMKNAGMRYAVLTTRHTSGFLLWDSPTTELDVGSSPGKPDVAGEFVKECRKAGITPGFYYCLWGGKGWMPNPNAREMILAQLNELATKYGEIPYFWIDMGNWRPGNLSIQEIYDSIKNAQPNAIVIMNQHIQDGQKINYFPTDVMNGEVVVPPAGGHQPLRTVNGKQYYLPFEFEPISQRISKGTTTPVGAVGAWFTYGEGKGFEVSKPIEVKVLFDWIKQAYDRGAANVLLSLAADHTGSMREDDVKQLEELGKMLREAKLLDPPTETQH